MEAHSLPQPATRAGDNSTVPDSAPASQGSSLSGMSAVSSSAPQLQSSTSNLSQLTSYSDLTTAPSSSAPAKALASLHDRPRVDLSRARTPDGNAGDVYARGDYAITSPMSVTSPTLSTNGTKRTASGHVKNNPSLSSTSSMAYWDRRRSRAESVSSTGSRAGELAASLKTRLGYAMAKVQNGWEHKSIAEVERLAAQKMSTHRRTMSHLDHNSRPWTASYTNGASVPSSYSPSVDTYVSSPPSKRHSVSLAPIYTQPYHNDNNNASYTHEQPRLQPAVDLNSTPRNHNRHHRHTPSASSSQPNTQSSSAAAAAVMSPPRTPVNGQHARPRRPPTIRTETQTAEAERDALQALFQLGSPHNSQVSRHHTASAASGASSSSHQTSPGGLRSPDFGDTPRLHHHNGGHHHVAFARSESGGSSVESRLMGEGSNGLGEGRTERAMAEA